VTTFGGGGTSLPLPRAPKNLVTPLITV